MTRKSRTIAMIPHDLVPIILSTLSVNDVTNLRQAVAACPRYRTVADECNRRLSATLYIKQTFGHRRDLLVSMSQNSVILSGLKSLAFFLGDEIDTTHAPWEFYVNDCMSRATSFMFTMEKLGVVWKSPLDEIRVLLMSGNGDVTLSFTSFSKSISCGLWELIESLHHTVERQDTQTKGYWRKLRVSQSKVIITVPTSVSTCLVCSVPGYLANKSTIRLNMTNRGNSLDMAFLFECNASYEQSMITAHTAVHMYGQMTSKGLTYRWKNGRRATPHMDEHFTNVAGKQQIRGFNVRTADDGQSTCISAFNEARAPVDVVKFYDYMTRTLTWYQTVDFVEEIKRPPWMLYDSLDQYAKLWLYNAPSYCHPILEAWK